MKMNRRGFLFGSAAALSLAGCSTAKMGVRTRKPGEPVNIACIGYGMQMWTALLPQFVGTNEGWGGEDRATYGLPDLCRVTVVCDCDRVRAQTGAKHVDEQYAKRNAELKAGKAFVKNEIHAAPCRWCTDFREVLNDPTIDAVCIATPDHWHAYIVVEAMKHGKDVYCEKPLTYNVDESRKIIAAQEKYGRIFQCGSMQRSWDVFRTAVMVVRNGFIGDVKYVDANYGIAGKKLGGPSHPMRFWDDPAKAAEESKPNPNVDWDMWLGPSKYRPYSNRLAPADYKNDKRPGVHCWYPMFWRFDDETGLGYNGDWGAHQLDIAQWGLDMDKGGPFRVVRSDEPHSADLFHGGRRQYGMRMYFRKPYGDVELYHGPFGVWATVFYGTKGVVAVARGKIAVWSGGPVKPSAEVRKGIDGLKDVAGLRLVAGNSGVAYGTDAAVKKDAGLEATLAKIKATYRLDAAPVQLYKSPNQVRNFVECVISRKPTISPAEVGARGAVLCQLCNMSYVYDTGFDWDPVKMEFANGTGRGIPLKRDYCRNGWEVRV